MCDVNRTPGQRAFLLHLKRLFRECDSSCLGHPVVYPGASIRSFPTQGRNTLGTMTEPSGCW